MLYLIIRPLARVFLFVFFRKIYLFGKENIPKSGPVILASNHPNAFVEACIYAVIQPRPVHFLTRADVFKSPIANRILRSLNMLPIYRFKDGYSSLKNNEATFNSCYEILGKGGVVIIFSEASCVSEKRLRPLQRGTARLAISALESQSLDNVSVVPIGVNYAKLAGIRGEVMINIGTPLNAKDYRKRYEAEPNQTLKEFTHDLEECLKPMVIHFDNKEVERKAEYLLDEAVCEYKSSFWPPVENNQNLFKNLKSMVDRWNENSEIILGDLRLKNYIYQPYVSEVKYSTLGDEKWLNGIFLVAMFPIFLVGFLINLPPYYLAKYIAYNKVKNIEFHLSVRMSVMMIGSCIWGMIMWFLLRAYFSFWVSALMVIGSFLLGYFAIFYKEQWSAFRYNT